MTLSTTLRPSCPTLLAVALCACGTAPTPAPTTSAGTERAIAAPSDVTVPSDALPPMPVAVTSFGGAHHDGYAYVLGGYHGTPHDYHAGGQSRAFLRVPTRGGQWERLPGLDAGLQGLALVARDGELCRLGGNRILNAEGEDTVMRSTAEVGCYDPRTRTWTEGPALPAARSSHEATVLDGAVYVAGGWALGDGGAENATWADDLAALGPDGRWRSVPAPFRRRAVGVASAGGQVVVIGGLTPEREISRRVDLYDPETDSWSRGPDFPADGFGVAAVGVGDAVLASGRDGTLFRLTVGTGAWEEIGSLTFPRFFHQLVSDGESLIVLGGIGGMHTRGRTRLVERIALRGDQERVLTFSAPYPGQAKNRQAAFLHDDLIYFFGGNDSLGQHDFEPENFVADGWRLHLPSLTWTETADFPQRRQTMQTVTTDTRGLAVGGFGHDGTNAVTHAEAYAFDFESETWSERGGLPRGRTQFGLVAADERLWVFGGLNFDPARQGPAAFEHELGVLATPDADAAFEATDIELLEPRRAFAGALHDGRYYLVGGMREGFQLVDSCHVYGFAASEFTPIACPSQTRLSAHLRVVGDRLALVGGSIRGEDGMATERSIELYDPAADAWTVLDEELPFDPKHAHVLSYRGRILVLSTHNDEGRLRVALIDPR